MLTVPPGRQLSFLDEGDGALYDDYVETTTDPGHILIIIAAFISVVSILCLPLFVKLGTFISNRRRSRKVDVSSEAHDGEGEGGAVVEYVGGDRTSEVDEPQPSLARRFRRMCNSLVFHFLDRVVRIRWRKRGAFGGKNADRRKRTVSRGIAREARKSMVRFKRSSNANVYLEETAEPTDVPPSHGHNTRMAFDMSPIDENGDDLVITDRDQSRQAEPIKVSPLDNGDDQIRIVVNGPEDQTSTPAPSFCEKAKFAWKVAKYDYETMRILRLAAPYMVARLVETVSELTILAIISHYLGTDAAVAYAIVTIIIGISSSFMEGWVEAVSSLGSMAYGAENYEKAGQYLQTSCVVFLMCQIPFAIIWTLTMDKILLLMHFPEDVANNAKDSVLVLVVIDMMSGVNGKLLDRLLELDRKGSICEHDVLPECDLSSRNCGTFCRESYECNENSTSIVAVDLVILSIGMLLCECLFFSLNILITTQMGWLNRFEGGIFRQCAFTKIAVLKDLFSVALPLSFGTVLAYAEWEVLTIFAAVLGPAEASAWAMLSFVWDVFEATTEAIGDASEVRCAYQLGKGRPELAKLSSYKSMFVSFITSAVVTAIFLSLGGYLPSWLTQDTTIQSMLLELFPLMALGNITMTCGMVCWALIGAQGRYNLATSTALGCSFFITIPLAAMMTVWLRIDLQGLTFAVVAGYITTATLLMTFLLMSDWECLSRKIQDRMAAEEAVAEDDDDTPSSS
ncbi:hypothetical protein ACHAWF_007606 [Thalassiosira exigua]